MTIDDRLLAAKGYPRGFDYLRIILAVSVLAWHSVQITYGKDVEPPLFNGPIRPIIYAILPMFFSLSGFLVAGSLERTKTVTEFLTLRAVRIVPALAVEVLLSALIIGALLTTLPLSEYFSHPRFLSYFTNILGLIQFDLPGVFETNPSPNRVNQSLWTIPYELECYVALAAATLFGASQRPKLFLGVAIAIWVAFLANEYLLFGRGPMAFRAPHGRLLVLCFLTGILMFQFRRHLPGTWLAFSAALVTYLVLIPFWVTTPLATIPLAFVTVFLGTSNPPKVPILMDGDYSYGVYLFAYPIQQSAAYLFPAERSWWFITAIAVPASFLYAAFSWHVVEKPVLARRKSVVGYVLSLTDALKRQTFGRLRSAS